MNLIPLSPYDIETIKFRLNCCKSLFKIPDSEMLFEFNIFVVNNNEELKLQKLGDLEGFLIPYEKNYQFRIKNHASEPIYVYVLEIHENGRIEPLNLWNDTDILRHGLLPNQEMKSDENSQWGKSEGIYEIKLFFSPKELLGFFMFLTSPEVMPKPIDPEDLKLIQVKSFYYTSKESFDLEE